MQNKAYLNLLPSMSMSYMDGSSDGVTGRKRERGMVALFRHGLPSRKFFYCGRKILAKSNPLFMHAIRVSQGRRQGRVGAALPFLHPPARAARPFAVSLTFGHLIVEGETDWPPSLLARRPLASRRNELEAGMSPFPHFPTFRRGRAETQRAAASSARPSVGT